MRIIQLLLVLLAVFFLGIGAKQWLFQNSELTNQKEERSGQKTLAPVKQKATLQICNLGERQIWLICCGWLKCCI